MILENFAKSFTTLFAIVEPFGVLPLIATLALSKEQEKVIALRASIAVFFTLIISSICGNLILSFFGLSLPSFKIGGGILLLMLSLSMMKAEDSLVKVNKDEKEALINSGFAVVPLAIPLLSGPAAISHVITQSSQNHLNFVLWASSSLAILCVCLTVYFVLSFANILSKKLGVVGLNALTRIFGLILCAMAIETIFAGLIGFFPKLV